jgi:hypothetical protein
MSMIQLWDSALHDLKLIACQSFKLKNKVKQKIELMKKKLFEKRLLDHPIRIDHSHYINPQAQNI